MIFFYFFTVDKFIENQTEKYLQALFVSRQKAFFSTLRKQILHFTGAEQK